MQNSKFSKIVVVLAALVILIGIALQFVNKSPPQTSNPPAALNEIAGRRQFSTSSRIPPGEASTSEEMQEQSTTNDSNWPPPLPREKIEAYLEKHKRDATSLLAAFHATRNADNPSGDLNYLKEATTNFPSNPQVQWTLLAREEFPEERRKLLDLFKVSSPENSLANYLSAHDYFKNGKPEAAVNELLEATRKSQFKDYTMEARLGEEELRLEAGESPLEARRRANGWASDLLPSLASFKGLAQGMQELQQQYLNSDDTGSAKNLSEMSVALANRLNSGEGGKLFINQLVGVSIESIALSKLDQNASYDFLAGKTPKERMAELKQQRASFKELTRLLTEVQPKMSEAETLNYFDRQRLYGELEAARWLKQRYETSAPQSGNSEK